MRMRIGIITVSCALSLVACTSPPTPSPTTTPIPWVDQADGVTFVRDPAHASDAAIHRGTFSVGKDGCLYLTVKDDDGTKTYLAAVSPTAMVTKAAVSEPGGNTYAIGSTAYFGRAAASGPIPAAAASTCTGSTTLWSALLTSAP